MTSNNNVADIAVPSLADAEAILAVMADARGLPPAKVAASAEAALAVLKDGKSIVRWNAKRGALCHLSHYYAMSEHPGLPKGFTPGWITQVQELVPQTEGLMTDGTHPRLLVASLVAMGAAYPETLALPVFAFLDARPGPGRQPSTIQKWAAWFGAEFKVFGSEGALWHKTLQAAIDAGKKRLGP